MDFRPKAEKKKQWKKRVEILEAGMLSNPTDEGLGSVFYLLTYVNFFNGGLGNRPKSDFFGFFLKFISFCDIRTK